MKKQITKVANNAPIILFVTVESMLRYIPDDGYGLMLIRESERASYSDINVAGTLSDKVRRMFNTEYGVIANSVNLGFYKETIAWKAMTNNKVTEVFEKKPIKKMYLNGMMPVDILGLNDKCVGYFWTVKETTITYEGRQYPDWWQFAFICKADDAKTCSILRRAYEERCDLNTRPNI